MKEHMFQHSFKRCDELKYRCDESDFWGPNEHTMKMHMYRDHSEIIACAMCNFEAKEEDILDTHTFTCEMFKCNNCQSTFNMLHDTKTHMSKEHNGNGSLWHYKINVFNQEFFEETYIFASDILRKKKKQKDWTQILSETFEFSTF